MYEYIIAIGAAGMFLVQYLFILGKLSGRVQSCEDNIKWVRDFLLTSNINTKCFSQSSAIKISKELDKLLPLSWTDTLHVIGRQLKKCNSPFEYVVQLTDKEGFISLKKRAEKYGIPLEAFLLASATFLYDNKGKDEYV
ncbi:MAG: hypothetical protein KAX49_03985 [Halanaerobiales bacterium]|nr:hypothetical protein [Halanaerobiales bacterium]